MTCVLLWRSVYIHMCVCNDCDHEYSLKTSFTTFTISNITCDDTGMRGVAKALQSRISVAHIRAHREKV